jgi:hypothetical protein
VVRKIICQHHGLLFFPFFYLDIDLNENNIISRFSTLL